MRVICEPDELDLFNLHREILHPSAFNQLEDNWPGLMRRTLLGMMPAEELGKKLHGSFGRPSKELYSMAGLIFLMETFNWTHQEAVEHYTFDTRVHYALNLPPNRQYVCVRTLESYLKQFRESELAQRVFEEVTAALIETLNLKVEKQRLDSTHIYSNMAQMGRTRLMARVVRNLLNALGKRFPQTLEMLDPALHARYAQSDGQLFGIGRGRKAPEELGRLRGDIAKDMHALITCFENDEAVTALEPYQALVRVFSEQCVLDGETVEVVKKPGSNCLQNPSDPDATYDGHKGPGYQVQIAETFDENNNVNLVTAVIPETACAHDSDAVVPVLNELEEAERLPEMMVADTLYGSDENVLESEARGVELIAPVPGKKPEEAEDGKQAGFEAADFEMHPETHTIERCPAGHAPEFSRYNQDTQEGVAIFDAASCAACPMHTQCPAGTSKTGDRIDYGGKRGRIEARRKKQESEAFKTVYRKRSGIEGTMSALKRRCGLGRLRVRGKTAVYTSIVLKTAGYNMLQAVRALKKRKTRPIGTNPAPPALPAAPFSPQYAHFRLIQDLLASQFRQSSACLGNTPLAGVAA